MQIAFYDKHVVWRSIPIVAMGNKDIMTEGRQRLHGVVETILWKSECSRDGVLS